MGSIAGQILASSNEVTLNSRCCWESSKTDLGTWETNESSLLTGPWLDPTMTAPSARPLRSVKRSTAWPRAENTREPGYYPQVPGELPVLWASR